MANTVIETNMLIKESQIDRRKERDTFTSCRIKANENTSTLVSYSSFLKASGATYLPARDN